MHQAPPCVRVAEVVLAVFLCSAAFAQGAGAPPPDRGAAPAQTGDASPPEPAAADPFASPYLEEPVFPSPRIADAFRIRIDSRFLPSGDFDSVGADLYGPELRVRAAAPLSKRSVLQLTARFGASLYDFDGAAGPLTGGAGQGIDPLFSAGVILQGGVRLNDDASLFVEDEIWSLLAAGGVGSSWESGAFDEALVGNGGLTLGYEIGDLLRIALGVQLESRNDGDGLGWGPAASFVWKVSDAFTLRSRGQGLQLEYLLSPRLEVFATSFRDVDRFRLERRTGLPDDLTLRDEIVVAAVGFEWRVSEHFRLNLEAGAVAWRELRVKSREQGDLFEEHAKPGAYFDLRLEIRP